MQVSQFGDDSELRAEIARTGLLSVLSGNFFSILLLSAVPLVSPVILSLPFEGVSKLVVLFFSFAIFGPMCSVAAFYLLGKRLLSHERPDFSVALMTGAEALPKMLPVALVAQIGILLGLCALLIPGFIIAVAWIWIVPVAVFEGGTIREVLMRSAALTRGRRWQIFGMMFFWVALPASLIGPVFNRFYAEMAGQSEVFYVALVHTLILSVLTVFYTAANVRLYFSVTDAAKL